MKTFKKAILVGVSVVATNAAFAQTAFQPGGYFGLDLGYTTVSDQTQYLANSLVNSVGGSASVTQNTGLAIGRLFAGYKFTENFGLEAGALQTTNLTANFSGVSRSSVAYSGNVTEYVNGVDLIAVLRPSISSGLNNLSARVGVTYLTENYSTSVSAGNVSATTTGNISGTGYVVGLGYDAPLTQSIDMRIGYSYYGKVAGTTDYANVLSVGILGKF